MRSGRFLKKGVSLLVVCRENTEEYEDFWIPKFSEFVGSRYEVGIVRFRTMD